MAGGERPDFGFVTDPDLTNEENCHKLVDHLFAKADENGEVDENDGDSLALSVMEAAAATSEEFDRGKTQEKLIAIIGDQGHGKSTFVNLLMLCTEVDASQYGLVPAFGMPQASGSTSRPRWTVSEHTPKQSDWEATILAAQYLRQAETKSQLRVLHSKREAEAQAAASSVFSPLKAKKERGSKEFQLKVDKIVEEAVSKAIRPPCQGNAIVAKHMSEDVMKIEEERRNNAINTCNTFPRNNSSRDKLYEHMLKAMNVGDATSFIQIRLMWGPTYCTLVRTKTVEQLVKSMTDYPFELNLELFRKGEISEGRMKPAYELLVDMCAQLRVLAGEDPLIVEGDSSIDEVTLPSYKVIKICDEIREKAGKNIIIAGNGFHKEHDRVFVREELHKFLTPGIGIIVDEAVIFEPSLLLKQGLIIIDTPGTKDANPFRRAATRDAVQQADMVVALFTKASLHIGGHMDFLREAEFLKRMLYSPKTLKIMLLTTLNEKDNRYIAKDVFEQWNNDDEPLCITRKILSRNPNNFKTRLKNHYDQLTAEASTDTDSDDDQPSVEPVAHGLGKFEDIWAQIEPGVQARNLACLPLLYTSLCLNKGNVDGLDQEQRASVLKMTGGDEVLIQMLEMVDDKSKERMTSLVQKLRTYVEPANATNQQPCPRPLPAECRDICNIQARKRWNGERDKRERSVLTESCELTMNKVLAETEKVLNKMDNQIKNAVGFDEEHLRQLTEHIRTHVGKMKPSQLVKALDHKSFVPKISRTEKLYHLLFKKIQENLMYSVTGECAEELRKVFRKEITEMLLEKIHLKFLGRTRRQNGHKETLRALITEWSEAEIRGDTAGSYLKNGILRLDNVNKRQISEWKIKSCKLAVASMLEEARKKIEEAGRPTNPKAWTRLGDALKEVVVRNVADVCTDARDLFVEEVHEDFFKRAESLKDYYTKSRKLQSMQKSSISPFLSVYGSCWRKLLSSCAKRQDEEPRPEAEIQTRIRFLIDAFADEVQSLDQDVASSSDAQGPKKSSRLLMEDIDRQQLLRWMSSKIGELPNIQLSKAITGKKLPVSVMEVFATDESRPIKYFSQEAEFREVMDAMKRDPFQPHTEVNSGILTDYHEAMCVYDDPLVVDGNSIFRAMIHAVMSVREDADWPELIRSMRQRLVFNTLAQYSSSRLRAGLFRELSREVSVEKWVERMVKDGEPGDVFVIESFCNLFKVNVYLLTPHPPVNDYEYKRSLSFPAFMPEGALTHRHPLVFVRFPRGVFSLVKAKVRGLDEGSILTSMHTFERDDEERQINSRNFRRVMQNEARNYLEQDPERASKRARTSKGSAAGEGGSPAGGSRAGGSRAGGSSAGGSHPSYAPRAPSPGASPARASRHAAQRPRPCPPGWRREKSQSEPGRVYFINPRNLKEKMWEYPD